MTLTDAHRGRTQILERHLVASARIAADQLNRLERLQTVRATLRLEEHRDEADQDTGE